MAAIAALRMALNQGISSGIFIDTKIILYSHRDPSGRVCRPRALYANSHVLQTIPYFNDLLFGNFSESQSKDLKEPIDGDEAAEDYGYLSDSDLEDDEDEKTTSLKRKSKSKVIKSNPTPSVGTIVCEQPQLPIEKGKVVKIPDIAFVTFQAFLMYLYTDAIEFAPFGSEENRNSRRAETVNLSDDMVHPPSPKSVYRLADKYDVPALKNLALNRIRGELTKCDIVEESFSRFASKYDEIRNLYVERLAFVWIEDSTTETTRTRIEKKISSFVEGDLYHAMEMLSELWDIASKDGDIIAPQNPASSTTTRPMSPAHSALRKALVRSIRSGVFFDRKYWARYSKVADALKPVYFPSLIMNDKGQQLNKLVKHFEGLNHFVSDLGGDVYVESDCEGDPPGANEELPNVKEKEQQPLVVLMTGSFSAWKSLFFYCCTDEILFAPLTSQGVDRLDYIRAKTVSVMPPPCSPKSIYILANLLGIQSLCTRALADIRRKVTPNNVVSELFSRVTASQKEIMKMQGDLLIPNLKNPKTVALLKENIRHIPDGSLSHCASALNLVFNSAFELKKKKRPPPGPKFRSFPFDL